MSLHKALILSYTAVDPAVAVVLSAADVDYSAWQEFCSCWRPCYFWHMLLLVPCCCWRSLLLLTTLLLNGVSNDFGIIAGVGVPWFFSCLLCFCQSCCCCYPYCCCFVPGVPADVSSGGRSNICGVLLSAVVDIPVFLSSLLLFASWLGCSIFAYIFFRFKAKRSEQRSISHAFRLFASKFLLPFFRNIRLFLHKIIFRFRFFSIH